MGGVLVDTLITAGRIPIGGAIHHSAVDHQLDGGTGSQAVIHRFNLDIHNLAHRGKRSGDRCQYPGHRC
tara:strand:- start:35332 stop:35538 length:207 start_codon:yes stop_codon:yes gene_type:complete